MSKNELRLLLGLVFTSWLLVMVVLVYNRDYLDQLVQQLAPTVPVVPPPEPGAGLPVEVPEVVIDWGSDAGEVADDGGWVALERLDYVLGAWATPGGLERVTIVSRSQPGGEPSDVFWLQPYRLSLDSEGHPAILCGLYEGLHTDDSPRGQLPWRKGYCHEQLERALVVRVHLLRNPGRDSIRLLLGPEVDLELFQVVK